MTSYLGELEGEDPLKNDLPRNFSPKIFLKHWAIDLQYFYLFAIFGTILGILIEVQIGKSIRADLLWLTAKGVSLAVLYVFWKLITEFLNRENSNSMPIWQILFIGAIGGVFQSLILEIFIWLFALSNTSSFSARLLSSALFAGIWLPAQSVIVINFTKFQRLRDSIQDQILELDSVNLARKRLQKLDEKILREQIGNLVNRSQDDATLILEKALRNGSLLDLPEITRGLASDHLRLLAHEISELQLQPVKKSTWWSFRKLLDATIIEALLRSIRTRPLNKEWFLLVLMATISLPMLRKSDFLIGLFVLITICISAYIIQFIGFYFYTKKPRRAIENLILTTSCTIVIPMVLVTYIPGHVPSWSNRIAYTISIILITVFGHLAQAGLVHQRELLAIDSSRLQRAKKINAEINFELAQITKKWAQHIHGNVQSKLHAYSLVLEQAQERDDSEGVERAIEEISRTIRELDREQTQSQTLSLEEEVFSACKLWDGFVEIESRIQSDLRTLINPIVADIAKCLAEAITNSVRHGHAEAMSITIKSYQDSIILEVKDNGIGFTNFSRGLGSKTFAATTQNNWELVRSAVDNTTTLTLRFALGNEKQGRTIN